MKKILVLVFLCFSSVVHSETMSGPRFGVTYLSPETLRFIDNKGANIAPVITQFGWHFERKFFTTVSGPTGITALIPTIGAAEQGIIIPSLTWITGLRLKNGYEFGFGPNVSIDNVGMTLVLGHSKKYGGIYIPKNIALAVSDNGFQLSFMFGFNQSTNK